LLTPKKAIGTVKWFIPTKNELELQKAKALTILILTGWKKKPGIRLGGSAGAATES
jgi:hypothetical protein